MTGQLQIDNVDVYTQYGVYVERGGWNGLMSFPAMKEPESNDWQEYNGLEVDLDAPVLNTREFQMTLATSSSGGRAGFLAALGGSAAYHNVTVFGRTLKLRLTQEPSLRYADALTKFSVKLADDFPMTIAGHTYTAPNGSALIETGYTLGGLGNPASRLLSAYGISVLSGGQAEVDKKPAVKPNLLVNIGSQAGASYDDSTVRYKSKDVRLTCLMRATGMTQLWRNYDALLYDLIRPNARSLNGNQCYYKSMSVSEFYPDGNPWMKFSLNLCFI